MTHLPASAPGPLGPTDTGCCQHRKIKSPGCKSRQFSSIIQSGPGGPLKWGVKDPEVVWIRAPAAPSGLQTTVPDILPESWKNRAETPENRPFQGEICVHGQRPLQEQA